MSNDAVDLARRYHEGTKHPGGFLMDSHRGYDPSADPLPFKIYEDLEPIPLPLDKKPVGVSALAAISGVPEDGEGIPHLEALARILYFSAGITKRKRYWWGTFDFRAASCTGALYHIEIYIVCGNVPGLEAGVYHFDPRQFSLRCLRSGDYRSVLVEANGGESSVSNAPVMLVFTDYFWRNAVKYDAREYRHAFWDSGTILSHTLAMGTVHGLATKIVGGFVDAEVNRLLGLDTEREAALAMVPIGAGGGSSSAVPEIEPLDLKTVSISPSERVVAPVVEMHRASSLENVEEVRAWRGAPPARSLPEASGELYPLTPLSTEDVSDKALEEVILCRGSTRKFVRTEISLPQLATILESSTGTIPGDFTDPSGMALNDVYLLVNAVTDLPSGSYVYHPQRRGLELLGEGAVRQIAGGLALGQDLAADASVNLYFLTDLDGVLGRFGNRGYRAAQLEASIIAGRTYLAAYALGLGATGLTFFDDEVTRFFSPHAEGKSVMFLMAVGRSALRR